MRPETPNDRTRASKYAKILDGLARDGLRASEVPERIRALGGIEEAYLHFVVNGPFHTSLFPEEPVRPSVRPKRPLGKRKRKLSPWTGPRFSIFDR